MLPRWVKTLHRSICFPRLIHCDRTWLLFLGVHIRLLTRCKICFTLGLSNYFSLKSLSRCLKSHMNVPWPVDYMFIVWFKLWIGHFTVMDGSEAEGDLVLIQTFFALLWKLFLKNTGKHKNNLIYTIKQEGLYQNKVTLSLASIHNCKMAY